MSERTLGGYRLLSQLAVGGMAEIYVAKAAGASGWEKLVALKVIHPNFSEDPEFVQMLVDEAKLAVQLQHVNIVQTFDLGRVDEQYYIAMELIDGVDLYKLLRQASEREIDFPFEIAAFIAQEVSGGLDYAHRKRDSKGRPLQIVHRDVSPQNILCSYDGEVKIVDFGIAKAARRGRQTAAGVIKGKYYYMSPEQAWGDPIDGRTDVFSTGILLYEMLVGQMLYLEEDLDTLLDKVRKANIPPPSTKRRGVPRDLEEVVMRALRKRADDRFPTAGELGVALGKFLSTFAPDFNRGKLAAFIQQVLGDDPTSKTRDPRAATAMTRDHLPKDEHSLIFKLSELKAEAARAAAGGEGRRKPDQATSPVSMPELEKSLRAETPKTAGDFEENDATIVDGGADSLMAGIREQEPTRPMGGPMLRQLGSTPLVDDPARDPDEEETIDGLPPAPGPGLYDDEPDAPLPGMRARSTPAGGTSADRPSAKAQAPANRPAANPARPAANPARPAANPARPAANPARPSPGVARPAPGVARPAPVVARPVNSTARDPAARDPAARDPAARDPAAGDPAAVRAPSMNPARPPANPAPGAARPPANPAPGAAAPSPGVARPANSAPGGARPASPAARDPAPARPAAESPPFDHDDDEPDTSQRVMPTEDMRKPNPAELAAADAASTVNLGPKDNPVAGFADDIDDPTVVPPPRPPPPPSASWPVVAPSDVWPPAAQPWPQRAEPWPAQPPTTSPSAAIDLGARAGSRFFSSRGGRIALIAGAVSLLLVLALVLALAGSSGPDRATIQVVSLPPGAEVLLDEKKLEKLTPLDISDVDAQVPHHVRVSMRGYDTWESDVKFETGARQIRLQAVLVPTVGALELASAPPGAEVIVNGVFRGHTPITVGDLAPNVPVDLQLTLGGYKRVSRTIPWQGKRKLTIDIPLEKNR